jgi:hypothetical protein
MVTGLPAERSTLWKHVEIVSQLSTSSHLNERTCILTIADYTFPDGGRDTITSTMHWGTSPKNDAYWRATNGNKLRRSDFSDKFHTFGLEWSKDYLYTYVDGQLKQVLYWSFAGKSDMWQRGCKTFAIVHFGFLVSLRF